MYKVEIYEDQNEKSEIKEYIKSLKEKNNKDCHIKLNKIIAYIRMLENKGLSIGQPYIKHLEDDIWELRPLRDRILFAYYKNNRFVLLSVFLKQTKKTPRKEIEKAKRILVDYIKEWREWKISFQNGKSLKKN